MTKLLGMATLVTLLFFSGDSFSASKTVPVGSDSISGTSDPICHLTVKNPALVSTSAVVASPIQEQEGSTHCERPSKDNPDVGGKDRNKLGCTCAYKCVNGKPEEDNSDPEHRCKNFCKKEQCECSKPSCKS